MKMIQDTDNRESFSLSAEMDKKKISQDENQGISFLPSTSGGEFISEFLVNDSYQLIFPLVETLRNTKNIEVLQQTKELIHIITESSHDIRWKLDTSRMPEIHAINLEDESLLIEWIFTAFRIGFIIEPDRTESSWYLISNIEDVDINASGNLHEHYRSKVRDLLIFANAFS